MRPDLDRLRALARISLGEDEARAMMLAELRRRGLDEVGLCQAWVACVRLTGETLIAAPWAAPDGPWEIRCRQTPARRGWHGTIECPDFDRWGIKGTRRRRWVARLACETDFVVTAGRPAPPTLDQLRALREVDAAIRTVRRAYFMKTGSGLSLPRGGQAALFRMLPGVPTTPAEIAALAAPWTKTPTPTEKTARAALLRLARVAPVLVDAVGFDRFVLLPQRKP